mgnify:CR=1 FL=1
MRGSLGNKQKGAKTKKQKSSLGYYSIGICGMLSHFRFIKAWGVR